MNGINQTNYSSVHCNSFGKLGSIMPYPKLILRCTHFYVIRCQFKNSDFRVLIFCLTNIFSRYNLFLCRKNYDNCLNEAYNSSWHIVKYYWQRKWLIQFLLRALYKDTNYPNIFELSLWITWLFWNKTISVP